MTPQHERDKDEGKLINPAHERDKDEGIFITPIHETDWRDNILTSEGAKGTAGGVSSKLLIQANKELDLYIAAMAGNKYKPATAIAAIDTTTGKIVTTSNGNIPSKIAPELAEYANQLGGLGVKTSSGNTLGRCAEFRAANELMLNNPKLKLNDIQFTPALRPRTGEVVPRCQNCIDIFGVVE